MATNVTATNLISEARNNVKDLLDNRSNVADPISAPSEWRKMCYSREPDVKNAGFAGYPYFIIHPAVLNFEEGSTGNRQIRSISHTIEVEIVTSDSGAGDQEGVGLAHHDAISDDIMTTMLAQANQNTLNSNSLHFVTPEATGAKPETRNNQLVFVGSIFISFNGKKKVF